ncbi:MAG TPA: hypothetical protein VNU01_09165, partial [Egibacteraceae bacterium]|nr:hypothetical protein [Egibacteraceae bacterium]
MQGGLAPAGPVAAEIESLWWLMFWLGLAVFAVFAGALAHAVWRGRREREERGGVAGIPAEEPAESLRFVRGSIIGLGVVMNGAVLLVVLVATVLAMRAIPDRADAAGLTLDLEARQFAWRATYPNGATTDGEVRIPAGEPVALRLTSADVIHSFWVPALAGKLDALPDGVSTLVLQADEPGTYRGQCAEFCG